MKTVETIKERITENREEWFAHLRRIRWAIANIEQIYLDTRTGTPADTVAEIVAEIGSEYAVEIIASMVNRISWDGRISRTVKAWASDHPDAWDAEAADKIGIYSDRIHPAHLNQIAEELSAMYN